MSTRDRIMFTIAAIGLGFCFGCCFGGRYQQRVDAALWRCP